MKKPGNRREKEKQKATNHLHNIYAINFQKFHQKETQKSLIKKLSFFSHHYTKHIKCRLMSDDFNIIKTNRQASVMQSKKSKFNSFQI